MRGRRCGGDRGGIAKSPGSATRGCSVAGCLRRVMYVTEYRQHRPRAPGAPPHGFPIPGAPQPAGVVERGPVPSRQAQQYPPPRLRTFDKVWRYGLATLAIAFSLLLLLALRVLSDSPDNTSEVVPPPLWYIWLSVAVSVVAVWIIRYRRRHPLRVLSFLSVLNAITFVAGPITAWALISLCTRRRWREVWIASGVYLGCVVVGLLVNPWSSRVTLGIGGPGFGPGVLGWISEITAEVGAVVLYVVIGFYVGARRDLMASLKDRAESAERTAELSALQGQSAERNRIAREMHDVLAHRISLVSMHAGVLAYRDDLSPEQTREIARTIQENAHASMTELRTVLGSLRQDDAGESSTMLEWAPPEKPQPLLRDIAELLTDAEAGGAQVEYIDEVAYPELLPGTISRHAYRVVQEALTNARKHAAGSPIAVRVAGAPGRGLELTIRNPLSGNASASAALPGSGLGLVGARERAELTGGWAKYEVTSDNAFELRAWFPW